MILFDRGIRNGDQHSQKALFNQQTFKHGLEEPKINQIKRSINKPVLQQKSITTAKLSQSWINKNLSSNWQILSQLQSKGKPQVSKQEPKSSSSEESFDRLQQNEDDCYGIFSQIP